MFTDNPPPNVPSKKSGARVAFANLFDDTPKAPPAPVQVPTKVIPSNAIRIIAAIDVGAGVVCEGQLWSSLGALRQHAKEFWPQVKLAIRAGDAATVALWRQALGDGSAKLAG